MRKTRNRVVSQQLKLIKKNREILELFPLFIENIIKGCGREICDNIYCAAYPYQKHKTKQEAALYFFKEVQTSGTKSIRICQQVKITKSLQEKELNELMQECQKRNNFTDLHKRVLDLFGSHEALNLSFMINSDICSLVDCTKSYIDIELLSKMYQALIASNPGNQPNGVINELNNKIVQLLKNYIIRQYVQPKDFRHIMIVLLYPKVFSLKFNNWNNFFEVIFKNKYNLESILVNWYSEVGKDQFLHICENIKPQLVGALLQYANEIEETDVPSATVEYVCYFSQLLYKSNKCKPRVAEIQFQQDILNNQDIFNPSLFFIDYYRNQKNNTHNFTILNYPHMMNIGLKSQLLTLESQIIQHENQRKNFNIMGQNDFLSLLTGAKSMYIMLEVDRNNLIQDTLNILYQQKNLKLPLKVKFKGEQGIDEGGVRKEFFQMITTQLFDPQFGMFIAKANGTILWFNGHSFEFPVQYELVGIICGMAIFNSCILQIKFPLVVFKKLKHEPVTFNDLREIDEDVYKNLEFISNYEGDLEDLGLNFQVIYTIMDESHTYLLKEKGDQIPVTQKNKDEYIQLYTDWYLNKSIQVQYKSFENGFNKVVGGDVINFFNSQDLQNVIVGSDKLDFEELRISTQYADGYTENSEIVQWFWDIVINQFSKEDQKKFLQFCTGSDRSPIQGLHSLKFIIVRHGDDSERLPSASTCFSHFFLPQYTSKEKLKQKLLQAIYNGVGFYLH